MPDPAVHAPDLCALRLRGAKRDPRVQVAVEGEHIRPYRIHASEHVLHEGGAAVAPQRLQRAHVPLPRHERRFRGCAVAKGADARLVRPRGARAGRKRAQQRGRERDRDAIRRRGGRRETRGAGHGGAARSGVPARGDGRPIALGREKTKRRGLFITANAAKEKDEKICKIFCTASSHLEHVSNLPRGTLRGDRPSPARAPAAPPRRGTDRRTQSPPRAGVARTASHPRAAAAPSRPPPPFAR